MSEDFLFIDGDNPSALHDIVDDENDFVNPSERDIEKILSKFIQPTLRTCKYDESRFEKSLHKFNKFVNRFIQMLVRVLRMYTGAIKFNYDIVPISLKRLHSIMSGGCKIIQLSSGEFKILPNSYKYQKEIMFVLEMFFSRKTIGNNSSGCSTWIPKIQPSCSSDFINLLICLFYEQSTQFEKLLHFFKIKTPGKYNLECPLISTPSFEQVISLLHNKKFQ